MNDKNYFIEQIITLLKRYQADLLANGEFNLLNSHVHAEYFLKQLLNHVSPTWKLKHTSESFSHNTSSIDLFSDEHQIVVQITAQKTNHRDKIESTIKKYNLEWKTKYPRLRIFFIKEAAKELINEFETADIKILSFNNIISKIQSNLTTEEAYQLLEFIKHELGNTYGSPYTFESIDLFEKVHFGKENDVISNTLQYNSKLLFYSHSDISRVEKLHISLLKNKTTRALLEGPPCVGKTTLTFELVNQMSKDLIKTFYVDLSGFEANDSGIKKDIDRISVHDALLIIDNSQENFDLAKNIYGWLNSHKIRALFISRFISNADSSASFSNYDFDEKINLNEDFENDSVVKRKIDGIINNRIRYLKTKLPQFKWAVKDINTVYANSELNYLKLSIILYFWENKYQAFQLEQIGNEELYTSFYDHHKLENHNDQTIFKYASLYKYDYPFHLSNIDDKGTSQLIEKGIILKRKFYENFFFPHVEYANLLAKAISYKRAYSVDREADAITQYIEEKRPKNIHLLINNLGDRNKTELFNQIFCNTKCSAFLIQHYQSINVKVSDLKMLFFFINEFRDWLDKKCISSFLEIFLSKKQYCVFNLFEKDGYNSFQNLQKCLLSYDLDTSQLSKIYSTSNTEISKRVNGKTFFEISEVLTSNTREPKFASSLVNRFSFIEWNEIFQKQAEFSLQAEGINNLRKNPLSRQLAFDLYNELEIPYTVNQLKRATIDIIGKALSDLSEFEAIDYKSKPRQIFKLLFQNGSLRDSTKNGLSKYSIGIAHLSKINSEIVQELFPLPEEIKTLFHDASANDFAQRVPLFVKHFPSGKGLFVDVMRKSIGDKKFLTSEKNDLNGLIKLIELLRNAEYGFSKAEINPLIELAVKKLSEDESLVHLSDAAYNLKSILSEEDIYNLISAERISTEFDNDKISIRHLESILIQNIKNISPKIAYHIYTKISLQSLADASIAANSKTPISFEQLTKIFMMLHNLEKSYFDKDNISESFTGKIFDRLISNHYKDFISKANKASLYDFITGYTRLFEIEEELTEIKLSQILKLKSEEEVTGDITLSNFSQSIRRLAKLKGNGQINYKTLSETILKNTKQHLINNAELIDIGKISAGLKELSIEFKDFAEVLFHDLRFTILKKGKKDSKRPDFTDRVIPELISAAGKDLEIITELSSYAAK